MIRSELVQKLMDENPHLYQRDVERIVSTIFEEIIDTMAGGDRVELRGFGAFSVKIRGSLNGRIREQENQLPLKRSMYLFLKLESF